MKPDNLILDSSDINRIITRIAYEIIEKHKGVEKLALIGIQTRGVYLAKRLQAEIERIEGVALPIGELDINLYRDDWTMIGYQPVVKPTDILFEINGIKIILVDDVLFTGRTIRAAMDALMDFGRPARIELAVLADRGYREFPIQPDYTGRYIDTNHNETVNVLLLEHDGKDEVIVEKGQ